jgi:hypothetical protein
VNVVRRMGVAISSAHQFIYVAPEGDEEAAKFGVGSGEPTGPSYFAFRAAALGAVPWQVVLAVFYNFAPRVVRTMTGVWDAATPEQWQDARFAAVGRAMRRVGVPLTADEIAEARSLIDPVVAGADYAGKTLAAANASVPLPADPLVALWQQIAVLREWRGDAHFALLAASRLGPCDCNVANCAAGRHSAELARATRRWNEEEWAAATARLMERGWLDADAAMTEFGAAERERIEAETDELCAPLWAPTGDDGALRLAALVKPIRDAFVASGAYGRPR